MSTWMYRISLALILALVFYWLYPNDDPNPRPELWDIQTETNQLHVLAFVINKTTLNQAMQQLKSTPTIALFTKQATRNESEPAKHLEAYFDDLFDQDDTIILGIDADETLLYHIKKEAYQPELFPNGVIRVGVKENLYTEIQSLPILSITIVAGQQIDFEAFQTKFGKPDQLLDDGQGNAHFLYPKLGLDVIQPAGGAQILQFVAPDMFEVKLHQPLLKNLPKKVN
ncbi:MAG: hypothetical protein R8M14_03960 [Ghiorsea sp.]